MPIIDHRDGIAEPERHVISAGLIENALQVAAQDFKLREALPVEGQKILEGGASHLP